MIIKEIQEELKDVAKYMERQVPIPEHTQRYIVSVLKKLCAELPRRKQHKTGRVTSRRVTVAVKSKVWEMRQKYPNMTQAEIADACHINSGRVSEILHGFRR